VYIKHIQLMIQELMLGIVDPFTLSLIASGVSLGVQGLQQRSAAKRADAQELEARQNDERVMATNKFQSDSLFLKSYPTAGIEQTTFAKYGGWVSRIKKMGKGGPTPKKQNDPIYVTDPNDPRLKSYQDSLMLNKESMFADSLITSGINNLAPELKKMLLKEEFNLKGDSYSIPNRTRQGDGLVNLKTAIDTYPTNPKTGKVSAGPVYVDNPYYGLPTVKGIAPVERKTWTTRKLISPHLINHDDSMVQGPFSDPRFPGYNYQAHSKGLKKSAVTEETFKAYSGKKPITNVDELRRQVGDRLSPDGKTIKEYVPSFYSSVDLYAAPKQPVFYQKPPDTTPNPGSRLQIKAESGSWFDVDNFNEDYSQVRYGNTTVVKPDPSRLRSVPGRNFGLGGTTIPDYIAEGEEVVDFGPGNVPQAGKFGTLSRLSSNTAKINGDSHDDPSGGVEMTGGDRVFSDRLPLPSGFISKLRKL
jgi:hypothetical protein